MTYLPTTLNYDRFLEVHNYLVFIIVCAWHMWRQFLKLERVASNNQLSNYHCETCMCRKYHYNFKCSLWTAAFLLCRIQWKFVWKNKRWSVHNTCKFVYSRCCMTGSNQLNKKHALQLQILVKPVRIIMNIILYLSTFKVLS